MCIEAPVRRQRGISMIELIMFIVVVGFGVAGILSVLNVTAARSSDPLPVKQALAIAESLLEEVELAAYTWCDPVDANVLTAASAADCATLPEVIGPEAGNSRPFDNVNDYHDTTLTGITDITGAAVTGLGAYRRSITVTATTLNTAPALLVIVRVTGPGGTDLSLSGYRTRYAPNSIP
jgi:MSHA pilin protein MshD